MTILSILSVLTIYETLERDTMYKYGSSSWGIHPYQLQLLKIQKYKKYLETSFFFSCAKTGLIVYFCHCNIGCIYLFYRRKLTTIREKHLIHGNRHSLSTYPTGVYLCVLKFKTFYQQMSLIMTI